MNMRHSYLYGTAGLTKAEIAQLDPIDPDADDYADRYLKVAPKVKDSDDD